MQEKKSTTIDEANLNASGQDDADDDIVSATFPIASGSNVNDYANNISARSAESNVPRGERESRVEDDDKSPLYHTPMNDGTHEQIQQNHPTMTKTMLEIDNGFNDNIPIPAEFRFSNMNAPNNVNKRKQGPSSDADTRPRRSIAATGEILISNNRINPAQAPNRMIRQAQVSSQINQNQAGSSDQNSFDVRMGSETNSRTLFYEVEATLVQTSARSNGNRLFPEAFAQTQVTAATPVIEGVLMHDNDSFAIDNDSDIISNEDDSLDSNPNSEGSPTTSCWRKYKISLTVVGLVVIAGLAGSIATLVAVNNSNDGSEPVIVPLPIPPQTSGQGPSPSKTPTPTVAGFSSPVYYSVTSSPSYRPTSSLFRPTRSPFRIFQPAGPSPVPSVDSVKMLRTPNPYSFPTDIPTPPPVFDFFIPDYLKPDWEQCTNSYYCQSGCCSSAFSDDSLLRCTPDSLIGVIQSYVCVPE
ncbi:hypothetical protein ACHAXS_010675 [Conticribra weissflogii]